MINYLTVAILVIPFPSSSSHVISDRTITFWICQNQLFLTFLIQILCLQESSFSTLAKIILHLTSILLEQLGNRSAQMTRITWYLPQFQALESFLHLHSQFFSQVIRLLFYLFSFLCCLSWVYARVNLLNQRVTMAHSILIDFPFKLY